MDEFSIDKHWNEFVEEGLYILCTTKELAEEFLRLLSQATNGVEYRRMFIKL